MGDSIVRVETHSYSLERNAESIVVPPRDPASPTRVPVSECQFETIRHVVRIRHADACPAIGEVNDGAGDGAVRKDLNVFQKAGAPDGSAVVHNWTCW